MESTSVRRQIPPEGRKEAMKMGTMRRPPRAEANGRKILVVDDDEGIRQVLVEILHRFGYEAVAVASGEEALAVFEEARPALLITDHHMPGMRGAELIRALRQRSPSLPIIALTGTEADEELLAAGGPPLKGGASFEILKKSCDIGQIREAVERGLKGKAARKD